MYVARKRLKIGDRVILPGETVPEAAEWPRVESWVHSGHIEDVPSHKFENVVAAEFVEKAAPKKKAKSKAKKGA
jgi:hypothetical protein